MYIFPLENITKVLGIPKVSKIFHELPKPGIGDDSRAWRIGTEEPSYLIEFIKSEVFVGLSMSGNAADYGVLTDLAKKAESKISP